MANRGFNWKIIPKFATAEFAVFGQSYAFPTFSTSLLSSPLTRSVLYLMATCSEVSWCSVISISLRKSEAGFLILRKMRLFPSQIIPAYCKPGAEVCSKIEGFFPSTASEVSPSCRTRIIIASLDNITYT